MPQGPTEPPEEPTEEPVDEAGEPPPGESDAMREVREWLEQQRIARADRFAKECERFWATWEGRNVFD